VQRLLTFLHGEPARGLTLAEVVEHLGFAGTRARVELLAALPDEVLSRIRFEAS
jgi:hypothetical protein